MSLLFHINYFNNAWGYVDKGVIILDDGTIWKYDMSGTNIRDDHSINKKLSVSKKIKTIDPNTLNKMIKLLECASKLEPVEISGRAFDKGVKSYKGYRNDKSIILYTYGDYETDNKYTCMNQLVALLKNYDY